jgi:hypothetical protein
MEVPSLLPDDTRSYCHCEDRSDAAISLDFFASLAVIAGGHSKVATNSHPRSCRTGTPRQSHAHKRPASAPAPSAR